MSAQRFFISCRLPGLNEIVEASKVLKGKWSRYAEMKVLYESLIKDDIRLAKLRPCLGRVRISLHWIEPNARRDYGNIRAGEKFITDALVTMKILKTDSRKQVVGFVDTFAVDKAQSGCWVTLEEIV